MSPDNRPNRPYRIYREIPSPDPVIFPPDKVAAIIARGNQKLSPFWILGQFGITFAKNKEDRDEVLRKILASKHGASLEIIDTTKGKKIRASQAVELLRAEEQAFPFPIEHTTLEFRRKVNSAFGTTRRPLQKVPPRQPKH